MLPKILIIKGYDKISTESNLRLEYEDINKFLEGIFEGNKTELERN